MRPMFFILLPVWTVAGAWAAEPVPSPPADPVADAWQALANFRPEQALPRFEQLAPAGTDNVRAVRFGTALSLLAQPSAVPNRVEKARAILAALAADESDDIALGARFYLGRLAEFQVDPPDPVQAAAIFRRLIAEYPDSIWAQVAVSRLAIVLLYTAAGPSDPAGKIAAAELLQKSARHPLAIMELHLVISDAVFHYRLPDGLALPHLIAAEQAGGLDSATRADVLVQIGEISRLTGQPGPAARYYRTFLAEYPRDARQYPIRQKLASLGGVRRAP